jgi:Uma2 family endonuclease
VPARWTLDDYHCAIDAGVFRDRRIELLHGELFEMPPINAPHINVVRYLTELFFARLGRRRAYSQSPIILPSDGEPEPDIAVSEPGAPAKPRVEQVQLAIEVSQATRRQDLGSKLEDYLRDGLRELWIIDLVEQCAWVYRGGVLVARHARGTGAQLTGELVPEVTVDLDEVFRASDEK